MKENYDINKLNPRKNPYVTDEKNKEDYLEYKGYRTYMKYEATDCYVCHSCFGEPNIEGFY